MSKNDEKILLLKKQIEEKKLQLGEVIRFYPVTNCILNLDDITYNINTLDKDKLTFLMIKLNVLDMSRQNLGIEDFTISGYIIVAWMTDIKNRINIINRKEEENKLKQLESKLTKMLSDEKKTELELDEIADLLRINK